MNIGHFGRGGGVSVYIKNDLCSTLVCEEYIPDINSNYVVVKLIQLNIYIVGIYRPPIKINERTFIQKLEDILNTYKNCFIVGDFNLDLLHRTDEVIMNYKEMVISMGFNIINKIDEDYATRVTETSSTIIDHILTDNFNSDFNMLVDEVSLSDHRFLLLSVKNSLNCSNKNHDLIVKQVVNYEKLDMHSIWNQIENIASFDELIEKILTGINSNREQIDIKVKSGNQPWVSNELLNLIKHRNQFYRYKKKYSNDTLYVISIMN